MKTLEFVLNDFKVEDHTPKHGGTYGDKGVLRICFSGVPNDGKYRVEVVDGAGVYDAIGYLQADGGEVTVTVPTAWTSPGTATFRLVEVTVDKEFNETERRFSDPCYVRFDGRGCGALPSVAALEWMNTLDRANAAEKTATACAADALNFSDKAQDAQVAAETAQEKAETAMNTAETQAQNAKHSATLAALQAQLTAQHVTSCEAALQQVEELCGITDAILKVVIGQ